jgi:hypothetical protein
MTRVSVGIRASELCDAHLIKERIEILRIPNNIKSGKAKINLNKIPQKFKLGTGHVKFFENKLLYVYRRYSELTVECILRGFKAEDYSNAFDDIPMSLWNDYNETDADRNIVIERVSERLKTMKNLKYYREPITVEELILKME